MRGPVQTAEEAWGDALPEWVASLAAECAASSQSKVAKKMGKSSSAINRVLHNTYGADTSVLEEAFLGVFRNARIECPALGTMPIHECRIWRAKAREFAAGNPLRLRMYRACARCPRNQKEVDQ